MSSTIDLDVDDGRGTRPGSGSSFRRFGDDRQPIGRSPFAIQRRSGRYRAGNGVDSERRRRVVD